MKRQILAGIILSLFFVPAMADTTVDNNTIKADDNVSYSLGVDIGSSFKKRGVEINTDKFVQGLNDSIYGGKLSLTDEEMKQAMQNFQRQFIASQMAHFKKESVVNATAGDNFLVTNKKADGVITTDSGLQYKVITEGTGAKPSADDSVTVEYTGKLISGKVFDSSDKGGKPVTFKLNQVIPGWTEVLQLMPQGSTWEVYIPATLAYGDKGAGGLIGPNETLIFNIHLVEIQKNQANNQ